MDVTRGCTPFWQPNPNQPTHPTSSVVQIENRIGTYLIKYPFLYYISLPDWMYIRGGSGLFVGVFRVLRPDWVPTSTTCMSANPEKCPQCTCTNVFCSPQGTSRASFLRYEIEKGLRAVYPPNILRLKLKPGLSVIQIQRVLSLRLTPTKGAQASPVCEIFTES